MACKNKWLNLRDQYRRIIKKHKIAESQGLKKKKWRFEDEMFFLQPYFREKTVNPNSFHMKLESAISECEEQEMTFEEGDEALLTTSVFEETSQSDSKSNEKDAVDAFFVAMAETVKTFPPIYQHIAKNKIFNVVSGIEIEILEGQDDKTPNNGQSPKQEFSLGDT